MEGRYEGWRGWRDDMRDGGGWRGLEGRYEGEGRYEVGGTI